MTLFNLCIKTLNVSYFKTNEVFLIITLRLFLLDKIKFFTKLFIREECGIKTLKKSGESILKYTRLFV